MKELIVRKCSIFARIILMFAVSFEFFGNTDLKADGGGGGLELYDAEAPLLDECATFDMLKRGVVLSHLAEVNENINLGYSQEQGYS